MLFIYYTSYKFILFNNNENFIKITMLFNDLEKIGVDENQKDILKPIGELREHNFTHYPRNHCLTGHEIFHKYINFLFFSLKECIITFEK